ncbi:LAMI_0G15478g1_1 [Lachancea mirantina]|uniref:ferric-chelate reductase (NADPH) n=1 Tax=Lachancea mirantina TaxID=1230905 RepID=A0A1G4KCR8_9SACH|nr:LAMI_0G15478g1_1 [Lachancea mirantina]
MKLSAAIVTLLLTSVCTATLTLYTHAELVGLSCKYSLAKTAKFCKDDALKSYDCYCRDINALGSFMYCGFSQLHSRKEYKQLGAFYQVRCPNITIEMMKDAYKNVTSYLVDTSKVQGYNASKVINYPVVYKKPSFTVAYDNYFARYSNYRYGVYMGAGFMGYWGIVLLCGTVVNILRKTSPNALLSINKGASNSKFIRWYRKNISIPALCRSSHTNRVFLSGLLPTRIESVIVLVFFVLALLCHSLGYMSVQPNFTYSSRSEELTRYVGDRSAALCLYLMVLTFLFGGRNQIFLFLTGWKLSTFLTYHKWLARMLMMSVLVHTITMVTTSIIRGIYDRRSGQEYWKWGILAVVVGSTMLIQGFSWLRERNYELFLYVHIGLAVLFLVGAWRHIEVFGYEYFAYASAALWCFSTFIRLVRLAGFGIKTAQVVVVSDETLQITVQANSWWPFFPGSFGYVHFITKSAFWQSHPFTIVKTEDGKLRFYVKIKNGVTKRLHKKLMNAPNKTGEIKIAVEGPYGDRIPIETYDQVLLYTGGNGIPGPYAYAKTLCEAKKKAKTKFVKLYWVIRNWSSLDWFLTELKALQKHDKIQAIVYVTRYHEGKVGEKFTISDSSSSNHSEDDKDSKAEVKEQVISIEWLSRIQNELPHVEFREGRPPMPEIIANDVEEAKGQNIAIMSCAHNHMCDEIRAIVANQVGDYKNGRIDLFEELQTW